MVAPLYRLALGILAALSMTLAAPAASDALPVRIEVPLFEGGEGMDFYFQCARAYERQRPGVEVDLYGDPRIEDKIRVRLLEGKPPEILNVGPNFWPLIRNGDILALDELLDGPNWEGDSTWRASFLPGSLDYYRHEGKTYGIPLFYGPVTTPW